MKTSENNENKQLTELTEEELKEVTGGDNGQQLYYFRPSLTAPKELNDLGPICWRVAVAPLICVLEACQTRTATARKSNNLIDLLKTQYYG